MLKVARWWPYLCGGPPFGCAVEEEWDDGVTQAQRDAYEAAVAAMRTADPADPQYAQLAQAVKDTGDAINAAFDAAATARGQGVGGNVLKRIHRRCGSHGALSEATVYQAVKTEDNRWQRVNARLLQAFPAQLGVTDPTTGDVTLRPDAYRLRMLGSGASRQIEFTFNYLSNAQKNQVQTWCDTNIGAGVVVVL